MTILDGCHIHKGREIVTVGDDRKTLTLENLTEVGYDGNHLNIELDNSTLLQYPAPEKPDEIMQTIVHEARERQ